MTKHLIPTQYGINTLIALYMVNANTDSVNTRQLIPFFEYVTDKLIARDLELPQDQRFNSMFLFSQYYLSELAWKEKRTFEVVEDLKDNHKEIKYIIQGDLEQKQTSLKKEILAYMQSDFYKTVTGYAQEYMKEHNINQPKKKQVRLTQEQEDERWQRYFGR